MKPILPIVSILLLSLGASSHASAQDAVKARKTAAAAAERNAKLAKLLSGSKLVGRFTVLGKDQDSLPKEEYTILSAEKKDKGDWWLLKARVKYGDKDVTAPIPLKIKWADDTPVITVTNIGIPGLGTALSSRVVIYNNKYAGTWTHGEAGGHMFGVIERAKPEESKQSDP